MLDHLDALYGGAAGGGKSSCLLMAALMFVDVPGYSAVILRRTFADLRLPGALIDRSREWLAGTGARWNSQEHRWRFPSGASLQFGYADGEADVYRYQGAEFSFIGVDEATQFTEFQLRYLFSRLRRTRDVPVPLRYRLASNPGGPSHEYVKRRYITTPEERVFIPARLDDNPHLDREQYLKSLAELPPLERARLERGDWDAVESRLFPPGCFRIVEARPLAVKRRGRAWDIGHAAQGDPTSGALMSLTTEGRFVIEDVEEFQAHPHERDKRMKAVAEADDRRETALAPPSNHPSAGQSRRVLQLVESSLGAGVEVAKHIIRVLAGHNVRAVTLKGQNKEERATPLACQCQAGNVDLVRGPWNQAFIDQCALFPTAGVRDDMVDSAAHIFNELANAARVSIL